MSDETNVEEKDEQAETTNAAPALKKPVLLGRKLGMLQHFKDDGSVVGATIIVAEANVVTRPHEGAGRLQRHPARLRAREEARAHDEGGARTPEGPPADACPARGPAR